MGGLFEIMAGFCSGYGFQVTNFVGMKWMFNVMGTRWLYARWFSSGYVWLPGISGAFFGFVSTGWSLGFSNRCGFAKEKNKLVCCAL